MDQLLTVIIQTSPIPSHPSTALLEALFRSFQKADGLLESRIIIVCDGCEEINMSPSTEGSSTSCADGGEKENIKHGKASSATASRYREHMKLLRLAVEVEQRPPFVPHANGSVELLELSERHGSARGIQAVFSGAAFTNDSNNTENVGGNVKTPLVMICQHDNFFVQDVPLRACVQAMMDQRQKQNCSRGLGFKSLGVKCLHFMSTATMNYKLKVKKRYGVDIEEHPVEFITRNGDDASISGDTTFKLVPLIFWYGRTHLSYTDHYNNNILDRPLKTGDHLEELLGVVELEDIRQRGMKEAHSEWGTFVLDQGCGEVIYHLSGRRARAAAPPTDSSQQQQRDTNQRLEQQSQSPTTSSALTGEPTNDHGSFTTARSCRAIVPGLEIVSEVQGSKPQGKKFKQKCFHCGLKGHSYKWCPKIEKMPNAETIDLS